MGIPSLTAQLMLQALHYLDEATILCYCMLVPEVAVELQLGAIQDKWRH